MLARNHTLNMEDGMSLRDAVYETLKEAILTGELSPGERMMEIPLSEQLGVSRTPVREAIRRLQEDRLVIIQPKCGAKVADITEKSVQDALAVRITVEEMAVRLAAKNVNTSMLAKLRALNEEIQQAVYNQEIEVIFAKDKELHRTICEATDNQVLTRVTDFLEDLVLRYRIEYVRCIDDCGQLTVEHGNLIKALEDGDENRAARVIRDHITKQCNRICAMIRSRR